MEAAGTAMLLDLHFQFSWQVSSQSYSLRNCSVKVAGADELALFNTAGSSTQGGHYPHIRVGSHKNTRFHRN